jgi:hypothetical protein
MSITIDHMMQILIVHWQWQTMLRDAHFALFLRAVMNTLAEPHSVVNLSFNWSIIWKFDKRNLDLYSKKKNTGLRGPQ